MTSRISSMPKASRIAKRNSIFGAIFILLIATSAWASVYEDGVAAEIRGDYMNAARIFRRLASEGDANAQFHLSLLYGRGQGLPADYRESIRLLRSAARQGHGEAQFKLGVAYSNGRGVAKDPIREYVWFSIAAQSGYAEAPTYLRVAEERLSGAHLARARQIKLECQSNWSQCE